MFTPYLTDLQYPRYPPGDFIGDMTCVQYVRYAKKTNHEVYGEVGGGGGGGGGGGSVYSPPSSDL